MSLLIRAEIRQSHLIGLERTAVFKESRKKRKKEVILRIHGRRAHCGIQIGATFRRGHGGPLVPELSDPRPHWQDLAERTTNLSCLIKQFRTFPPHIHVKNGGKLAVRKSHKFPFNFFFKFQFNTRA